MQTSAKHTENLLKNNNIRLQNLVQYLQDLLTGCVGAGCDIVISFNSAFRVGKYFEKAHYPEDIIIQFSNWLTKAKVLEAFLEDPNLDIDGQMSIFPDLHSITVSKRQNLSFLTSILSKEKNMK